MVKRIGEVRNHCPSFMDFLYPGKRHHLIISKEWHPDRRYLLSEYLSDITTLPSANAGLINFCDVSAWSATNRKSSARGSVSESMDVRTAFRSSCEWVRAVKTASGKMIAVFLQRWIYPFRSIPSRVISFSWHLVISLYIPACSPHSFFVASSPHQRPSRSCWPGSTGFVQGSHPSAEQNPFSWSLLYGTLFSLMCFRIPVWMSSSRLGLDFTRFPVPNVGSFLYYRYSCPGSRLWSLRCPVIQASTVFRARFKGSTFRASQHSLCPSL